MKTQRALSDEQERIRLEGLRILARIIARHALAHPDLYAGSPSGERPPKPESTDRSLTGRAAGLPERSAGVPAFAGRCRSEEPSLRTARGR